MSKYQGISDDALKLRLFPWTLRDKAKAWLLSLPAGTITTWSALEEKFLDKFFPPAKTVKLKNEISNFYQWDQETLYETWERFKDLLRKCPNHGFPTWMQLQTFYNGLDYGTKQMLDAAAGGALLRRKQSEAYKLIEEMAINAYQYPNERRHVNRKETKAVEDVDVNGLSNQIVNQVLKTIGQQFGNKGVNSIQTSNSNANNFVFCDLCGSYDHKSVDCQNGNPFATDDCNFVGNFQGRQQNNPYSNTYNPGWSKHPNFSWANNNNFQGQNQGFQGGGNQGFQGANQQTQQQNQAPQFNNSNPSSSSNFSNNDSNNRMSKLEEAMANMMKTHDSFLQETRQSFKNQEAIMKGLETQIGQNQRNSDAAIKSLENQIGQLAIQIPRNQGTLPSQTEKNPNAQVHAIVLRSGKEVSNEGKIVEELLKNDDQHVDNTTVSKYIPPHAREVESSSKDQEKSQATTKEDQTVGSNKGRIQVSNDDYKKTPPPPFPSRFRNTKLDDQFKKFLDMFKKLHVNIPFIDALKQMPSYAKFMKEVLSNKKRWETCEFVALSEQSSARLQYGLPPKLEDPGSFNIPCNIGHFNFMALCDLGASINLMPYNVYRKLGVGDVKPTNVTLQMADGSIKRPRGILEDVLVKVNKFIFPVDFLVLDIEEKDSTIPLILGRPFLATGRALIDVQKGELTLRVLNEEVSFNVLNAKKSPINSNDGFSSKCFLIDACDESVLKFKQENMLDLVGLNLLYGSCENEISQHEMVGGSIRRR